MDDKWDTDIKSKKTAPKKGRRAGLGFFSLHTKDNSYQEESNDYKEGLTADLGDGKSDGWVDETFKSSRSKNLKIHDDQVENAVKDFDDGIPVIPNLEDNADEEFITKIANAPLIGVNKVATYKELETDLLKHTAFASLEEVNLRILTNYLYPESALLEPDEPWTRDSLLSEVISVMNDERERYGLLTRQHDNYILCSSSTQKIELTYYVQKFGKKLIHVKPAKIEMLMFGFQGNKSQNSIDKNTHGGHFKQGTGNTMR